jgi:hypothetical protein
MSRIVDSMKARITKIDAKILELSSEKKDLEKALSMLDKQEEHTPAAQDAAKEQHPTFLGKKGHEQKSAANS